MARQSSDEDPAGADLSPMIAHARAAWPQISLDESQFASYLRERLSQEVTPLTAELAAELYLVYACGTGDNQAIGLFEQHYLRHVPSALSKLQLTGPEQDEVLQQLRHKLFVAEAGNRPPILDYAGRGDLRALARVAAVRTAISLLRKLRRELFDPERELLALPDITANPELALLKEHHRAELRLAIEEAVATLARRDRALLRLHLLEGVGLQQLADSYGVHRATITRWIAAARQQVLRHTRQVLHRRLKLPPPELDSVLRAIDTHLDLSVRRLFAATVTTGPAD